MHRADGAFQDLLGVKQQYEPLQHHDAEILPLLKFYGIAAHRICGNFDSVSTDIKMSHAVTFLKKKHQKTPTCTYHAEH